MGTTSPHSPCYATTEGPLSIFGSSPNCWLTWAYCEQTLKSLLHTWILSHSNPLLSSSSWFYGLCLAWPNYHPSVLFPMAHKAVLQAVFSVPLLLKESEKARRSLDYRITELWGVKQKNIQSSALFYRWGKRDQGQINSRDKLPGRVWLELECVAGIRIWVTVSHPQLRQLQQTILISVSNWNRYSKFSLNVHIGSWKVGL